MSEENAAAPPAEGEEGGERLESQESITTSLYPDYESQKTSESNEAAVDSNRDVWTNKVEFLMTCISTAVGLGNVWRFPFTAYQNGGGAFLFPYVIVLALFGKPIYFVELQVGQFSSRGPVGIWDMVPMFRGVGWATIVIAFCTSVYYVSILGNCALYFYFAVQKKLPWEKCYYDWKDPALADSVFGMVTCPENNNDLQPAIVTYPINNGTNYYASVPVSLPELFFRYKATKTKDNLNDGLGPPDVGLSLSLLIVWLLIFGNIMLGTKTSGKVAYFTALFPYAVLFTLFIFVLTQDGAPDGVALFFKPDWAKVAKIEVWFNAMNQAFFSLGVGYGAILSYGSFNPFRQLPWTETTIVALIDLMTSVVSGLIVFATLGVLGKATGKPVEAVLGAPGPGLAFVSYPDVLSRIGGYPGPQIMGGLFFLMFLTLGVGSGSGFLLTILGALYDNVPILSSKKKYKIGCTAVTCTICYLFGLIFCTRGGWFMIEFIEHYSSGLIVFVVVVFEMIGISYVYGFRSFVLDIRFMFDIKSAGCGTVCDLFEAWGYLAPIFLIFILAYTLANYQPVTVGFLTLSWPLPTSVIVAGWGLFTLIISLIPIFAIRVLVTRKSRNWKKKFLASIRPNAKWGPKDPEEKAKWIEFRRNCEPTTALYRMTLGRLAQVPRTPIFLTLAPSTIVAPDLDSSAVSGAPEKIADSGDAAGKINERLVSYNDVGGGAIFLTAALGIEIINDCMGRMIPQMDHYSLDLCIEAFGKNARLVADMAGQKPS